MSDEIQVAGVTYVSSKRASRMSGYAQDYIGQLCRAAQVESQRVDGLWYVNLDSLYRYKQKADSYTPIAPRKSPSGDMESLISLDGKDYISASRAAEITGYHRDYVGQLAREGRILSRQIANRWYVDRSGILDHKNEKDALLASLQAESVGIARQSKDQSSELFFTYSRDDRELMPSLQSAADAAIGSAQGRLYLNPVFRGDAAHRVPIRVYADPVAVGGDLSAPYTDSRPIRPTKPAQFRVLAIAAAAMTVVVVITLGYVSLRDFSLFAGRSLDKNSSFALVERASLVLANIGYFLENWFVSDVSYVRQK